ncbi:MAG: hypothetical protein ACYDBB_25865 [Armatimonadota bacterium]
MRSLVLCSLLLLSFLTGYAAEPASPERTRINEILATINARDEATRNAAEEALVKLGQGVLPALRVVLAERQQALAEKEKKMDDGTLLRSRWEVEALDNALVRLEWGSDPRRKIIEWAGALKFADGRPFRREVIPTRVTDVPLTRAFPGYLFYVVLLPGYQGGAAPSDEILQSYEVPAPLSSNNLFAMPKDGKWQLITTSEEMKAFFCAKLNPVKSKDTAKDAAYSWLRLTQTFIGNGDVRFNMPMNNFNAKQTDQGWLATGIIEAPTEGNRVSGTVSVEMLFTEDGKLSKVTESQILEMNMLMVPC